MSATPLTDAYLASRCKGENKESWVEFARGLELKLKSATGAIELAETMAATGASATHIIELFRASSPK